MKIECILKRQGGTFADIDGVQYHFAPQPDGAHVATVKDDAHAQRFLGIAEGYRIYREKPVEGDLNGDGLVDEQDERLALMAQYEAKFGKKPHARITLATLRQQLAE